MSILVMPSTPSEAIPAYFHVTFGDSTASPQKTKKTYNVELRRGENGWIVVRCPDLPGVNTQGRTEKEAIDNALEAVQAMVEELGLDKEFNLNIQYKLSA